MALDPVGDRTLTDLLHEQVELRPAKTFLTFETGDGAVSELTYAELEREVEDHARGLAALGVGRGDKVVVHLRNSPEFLVAWFAIARVGAVLVPSITLNTVRELEHIIGFTAPAYVITEPSFTAVVQEGIDAAGTATSVIVARGRQEPLLCFDDLPSMSAVAAPAAEVGADDVAEILFTSGTTRRPKAVMLTHANCLQAGLDSVHCLWLDEGERMLTSLPMFHVNAQGMTVLGAMTVGGTAILIEEFSASRFWRQVREHRATQTSLVAMQLRTLLAQPEDRHERDHSLRRVFFAINVSDQEKERFEERYGVSLINGYGLSEAMVMLSIAPIAGPRRWPSIGLPAPGRTLMVLDPEGNEVAPGEVGEICARGIPGRTIMLGYLNDDEATARALEGGLLHTGDNGYADADGYLYFFDRKKDMIKRAGENIAAIEVEGVLVDHPEVAEVAVIGVPDPIRDEAVAAVVVTTSGASLDEDELRAHCAERLSRFKVPTVFAFLAELPKTSVGKVRKDELRKMLSS